MEILQIHTKKMKLFDDVDLEQVKTNLIRKMKHTLKIVGPDRSSMALAGPWSVLTSLLGPDQH